MEKPADIIDRDHEWALLARLWESDRPELCFVRGRRRVGKSFLLAPFTRTVRGIYFQATRRTEAEQLRDLSRKLGQRFEDAALIHGGGLPDWPSILAYLRERAGEEPFLLTLDEFPYLAEAAPSLTSVLQEFLDHRMRGSSIKLVLAGSHITSMRRLEAADQPLYARRTACLDVRPFDCLDAGRFVPDHNHRDRIRTYAAFGGVPGHLALLAPDRSFAENVTRSILDPSSRLHDEAQHMLDAFLGEARVHYSILDAIAAGQHTWSGITRFVGKSSGSLSRPMSWLLDMEIVRRIVPITVANAARTKRAVYRIDDPYVRFWHRFVAPLSQAGLGPEPGSARLFEKRVKPGLDDFMGPVFEDVCRAFVRRTDRLPFEPARIGEWWSRASDGQIDVVALSEDGEAALLGECKWASVDSHDLAALRRRALALQTELGRPLRVTYALFSGEGPSGDALRAAVADGEVVHFGLEDLFAG